MADAPERIARVGLAGWIGESDDPWDTPRVLGIVGDDLYLIEIDGGNRERVLLELIDNYEVDNHEVDSWMLNHNRSLPIEIAFFGDTGGFFASSMNFFELWPKSLTDVPTEVFVDHHHKAAFTKSDDEIVVSVRHALRSRDGLPKRLFRFQLDKYEQVMSDLVRESQRLRDDLLAIAQERAPEKVASLQTAFKNWPV